MNEKNQLNNGITSAGLTRRKALNLLLGGLGAGVAAPYLAAQSCTVSAPVPHVPKIAARSILRSADAPPVIWDVPIIGEGNVVMANYAAGYTCYQYSNSGQYIARIFDIRNGPRSQ